MKLWPLLAALSVVSAAQADPPDDQEQLMAWARLGETRVALGASVDSGGSGSNLARYGFFGTGRFDIADFDTTGVSVWVARLEAGGRTSGESFLFLGLLSFDTYMIGVRSAPGDKGRVRLPCIWYGKNEACTSGGIFGVGLDLLHWQTSLTSEREILRLGEVTGIFALPPAFGSSGTGGPTSELTWMKVHFPIRVGGSADFRYGGPLGAGAWIGRFVAGFDADLRFAKEHVELKAKFRYRPSFTAWVDDFGIESSLYIGYAGVQQLWQRPGTTWRFGLEVGYGYWTVPQNEFGVEWDEFGKHTGFVRMVFQPALWTFR